MSPKVTLEAAKHQAKIIFGKVAEGKDPANEKADARQIASHTLGATLAKYLEAKVASMKPRSYEETKRHLENLWKPLHGLALASIGRANVAAQVSTIAKENGPVAANRSRASLCAFFRWAIGEGLCDHNPVAGTNKEEESGPRERSLSDAETAAVWLVAPDNDYGRIVQLILLTGCRRDEIGSLQWPEIDLKEKTIKLPDEQTKNKQPHTVPLSDMMAVAILPQTAPAASRAGAPTIRIEEPDITRLVRSPVNIRIRFQAAANAKIDVNTLRVRYGRLGIDLTRRILAHARPTQSGVFVEDAELPRSRHRVTIQIADNMGRVGSKSFDFNVV